MEPGTRSDYSLPFSALISILIYCIFDGLYHCILNITISVFLVFISVFCVIFGLWLFFVILVWFFVFYVLCKLHTTGNHLDKIMGVLYSCCCY